MRPFRGLLQNWMATGALERRYHVLTSSVGVLGVFVGIVLLLLASKALSRLLDVPLDGPLGSYPNGSWYLAAFIVCIPLAAYVGVVLVAGAVAIVMVGRGMCTPTEAVHYALFSRYPTSWFRKAKGA
jgi:hypothetical protein